MAHQDVYYAFQDQAQEYFSLSNNSQRTQYLATHLALQTILYGPGMLDITNYNDASLKSFNGKKTPAGCRGYNCD